ncbi:MAG: hypothetical protein ACM3PT_07150 [Deltaproteobacteria bacterium]
MSFFGEIKKLLFGAKGATRDTIEKIKEGNKDSSEHLLDVNEDFLKNREKSDLQRSVNSDSADTDQKKSVIEQIKDSEVYKKTEETIEKIGDSILDTGEKFMEKSKEFIDGPGKKIADKFGEVSEDVGEKVMAGGKVLYDKAADFVSDLGEKLDETIQKAEKFATEDKETNKSDFADTEFKVKDSELSDKEDFFNKADRFSKGDFSDFPKTTITHPVSENKKPVKDIAGFEDSDKDGNPLIDDADIIEDMEDQKKS